MNTYIEALEESIAVWEKKLSISEGPVPLGRANCPLCQFTASYRTRPGFEEWMYSHSSCAGCPVYEATGEPGCVNTPYEDVYAVVERADSKDQYYCFEEWSEALQNEFRFHARREVAFLQGLLNELKATSTKTND